MSLRLQEAPVEHFKEQNETYRFLPSPDAGHRMAYVEEDLVELYSQLSGLAQLFRCFGPSFPPSQDLAGIGNLLDRIAKQLWDHHEVLLRGYDKESKPNSES